MISLSIKLEEDIRHSLIFLYNCLMYINKHKWTEAILFWDQELIIDQNIDVYYLLHEFDKHRGENISEHVNFRSKLDTDTPEERFSSSTRRKWKNLSPDYEYVLFNNLSEEELQDVIKDYNAFANEMHLTQMDGNIYSQMNKEGKLFVSIAALNGAPQYIHTFYVSQGISRLFHTFPTVECTNRDVNVGLHRFDLVEFRKFNVNTYDWGGAGFANETDEKKLAIREYKRRFGGEEFIYYKARVAGNEKGKEIIKEHYKY